jgi:ABC-2 type transport system permease protein
MLPIIFVMPIVQLVVLVHAMTFEIRNIPMTVVDHDVSGYSQRLIHKFAATGFFVIKNTTYQTQEANNDLLTNDSKIVMEIPPHFERDLIRNTKASIQLRVNAIDGVAAGLSNAYANSIIADFNRNIALEWMKVAKLQGGTQVAIDESYWYNPELNYKTFMVPGLLTLLITIIGMLLSGINLVREKEIGTMEQINVTPIKKYQLLIGKMLPFLCIALFVLSFGLTIGYLVFHIPIVGSLFLLFGMAILYLIVALGFGLLISTLVDTQQQAMFIAFFFMMIFIMMSGLFTSVESMPLWGQYIDRLNPVAYFVRIIRMILLKGSGFKDIQREFWSLLVYGSIVFTVAIKRYHKTS